MGVVTFAGVARIDRRKKTRRILNDLRPSFIYALSGLATLPACDSADLLLCPDSADLQLCWLSLKCSLGHLFANT